jgi:uncharacterized protein (DUF736 family)
MANIGTFKKSGHEYQGEIVTLSVQTKGVRIVPETNRASENAPSHRVYVGRAEIGAAWSKRSSEGRDYLSVKLDDPSFTAPIYANLVEDDGETFTLISSRTASRTATEPGPAVSPARIDRAGLSRQARRRYSRSTRPRCERPGLSPAIKQCRVGGSRSTQRQRLITATTPSTVPSAPLIGIGRVCTRPPICGAGPAALATFSISAWSALRFRARLRHRA